MRYEYVCESCGLEFIIKKQMKDSDKNEQCPQCGEIAKRVFSSTAIRTNDGYKQSSEK